MARLPLLDAESAHYVTVWDELSAHQRLVLSALAADPGAIYSEAYRQQHRLGSASAVQKSVSQLVARELIEQAPEGYRITDVFMRAWIRERAIP